MASTVSDERNKEEYSFIYGDEAVSYEVLRKPIKQGKKRSITIKVQPNCDVTVSTPEDAELEDIHQAVMKRAYVDLRCAERVSGPSGDTCSPNTTSAVRCSSTLVVVMY